MQVRDEIQDPRACGDNDEVCLDPTISQPNPAVVGVDFFDGRIGGEAHVILGKPNAKTIEDPAGMEHARPVRFKHPRDIVRRHHRQPVAKLRLRQIPVSNPQFVQ